MSLSPLPEEAPDSITSLDAAAASPLTVPPATPEALPATDESRVAADATGAEAPEPIAAEAVESHGVEAAPPDHEATAPVAPPLETAAPPAPVDLRVRLQGWWDEFTAWVRVFASAAVYATLIVTFLFQVARVDGQSMAPTLEDRDRLIVNKLAYRLGEPQRGDIVMLYYPLDPDKSYVKRVIAEEGDMVRVVDGQVFVNDVPLPDDQIPPEFRSHDEWGPQVVPEGYYFVMGDHRNNSSDSRHWGFVPKKYIIGRVQVRWWPIPAATVF
ncbi:MAG: signal peptidase I [Acidobacteria bacterium]|nr:signal peptidase I [Acidobacteriota bacterium]